ncbi:MAG: hypothetical protein ACOX39_04385 [Arcobacteraceae bacterium]
MQLVEILNHCGKVKTPSDLLNNIDSISELLRDDARRITKARGIHFPDFDFSYSDGVKILKKQLMKTHLKAIRKFFKCDNIEKALKWIVSRVINNAVNVSTNKKYKLYVAPPQFLELHDNIESNYDINMQLIDSDLKKFDRNALEEGLISLWEESKFDDDFDFDDMKYLCDKFNCDISKITGNKSNDDVQKYKKEQTESGHSQLVFVF